MSILKRPAGQNYNTVAKAAAQNGPWTGTVTGLATVLELDVTHCDVLWISMVVGVAALTDFDVAYRLTPAGAYFTVASVAADYTSPNGVVLGASGDLTTAASGATVHWLRLDVSGVESVRLQASGTASTLTGSFGAN